MFKFKINEGGMNGRWNDPESFEFALDAEIFIDKAIGRRHSWVAENADYIHTVEINSYGFPVGEIFRN